jgi:hypothetical protein
MKKLILTVALFLTNMSVNAQEGVVTIESAKSDVPLEQWYVIRDKEFNNHSFFYGSNEIVKEELEDILKKNDLNIDFPKGTDTDGDPYWLILQENEYILRIYISKGTEEYSSIIIVTE